LIVGEAGGWMRVGPLTMFVTATPVRVADSLRYADVEGAVRWGWRAIELSATAGSRSTSESALVPSAEWLTVAGTAWLSRRLAVTTAVGRYPTDYARGYPGGRYISAAVRLSTRPRAIAADERGVVSVRPRTLPPETDHPEPVRPAFEMHRGAGDSRTLRVRVERATTVEMTGDFTDWRAVSMRAEGDGWWTATIPIPSGIHQINVRTDGGAWSVPPGLASAADEFGGRVGLLLVP
jgi:hypothetical protein